MIRIEEYLMKRSKKMQIGPKTVTDSADNLSKGKGWSRGDSLIVDNGSGVNLVTMSQLNSICLGTNTSGGIPKSLGSVKVIDSEVVASDLIALGLINTGKVILTNATKISGSAKEIVIILSADQIDSPMMKEAEVTESTAAAIDLIAIRALLESNAENLGNGAIAK